jgi:hypothetical protein
VKTLFDERLAPAGVHQLTVDGRSDRGEALASGMYFYRIRSGEDEAIGRFVIAR